MAKGQKETKIVLKSCDSPPEEEGKKLPSHRLLEILGWWLVNKPNNQLFSYTFIKELMLIYSNISKTESSTISAKVTFNTGVLSISLFTEKITSSFLA